MPLCLAKVTVCVVGGMRVVVLGLGRGFGMNFEMRDQNIIKALFLACVFVFFHLCFCGSSLHATTHTLTPKHQHKASLKAFLT